jgi:hypothetical protein
MGMPVPESRSPRPANIEHVLIARNQKFSVLRDGWDAKANLGLGQAHPRAGVSGRGWFWRWDYGV